MPGTKISGLFGFNRLSLIAYLIYTLRIPSPHYLTASLLRHVLLLPL